eukprot:c23947_g1_i1 orf=897-1316(-)
MCEIDVLGTIPNPACDGQNAPPPKPYPPGSNQGRWRWQRVTSLLPDCLHDERYKGKDKLAKDGGVQTDGHSHMNKEKMKMNQDKRSLREELRVKTRKKYRQATLPRIWNLRLGRRPDGRTTPCWKEEDAGNGDKSCNLA